MHQPDDVFGGIMNLLARASSTLRLMEFRVGRSLAGVIRRSGLCHPDNFRASVFVLMPPMTHYALLGAHTSKSGLISLSTGG